jgi:murein DD-endopeptidase MepM/ murein hydrolase activator NlpD
LVSVSFVLAEDLDLSSVSDEKIFLSSELFEIENQDLKDFIFPLKIDQENLKVFVTEREKEKKKSGWHYIVKKGENLWEISKKFKVPLDKLLEVNNLTEKSVVKAGEKLVIPGVQPKAIIGIERPKNLGGKFVSALREIENIAVPVSGFNWGIKHGSNATDIAAPCGEEVYAASDGIVIESIDGWNGGYGNYILIKHNNGTYSLYGHLSLRAVEVGEKVRKGELIGYVGNTGHVLGPTGCHLHFEIRGGVNPLLR